MSRARSLHILVIAALLGVNLLAIASAAYWLNQSKQQFEQRAESQTRNIATAVERNLASAVEKVDFALQHLVDDLELHSTRGTKVNEHSLHGIFSNFRERLPEIEGLRVADAKGLVFLGTGVDLRKPVTIADRDYFQELRAAEHKPLVITKPVWGRLVNHYIIIFARRFNQANGDFGGIVFATVALDSYQQILSRFDLGPRGTIILRDRDAGLIVRSPPIAQSPSGQVGNSSISPEFRAVFDSGVASASFYTPQSSDNQERIFAFLRMGNAPMLINAGMSSSDYLAGWYAERRKAIASTGGFALVTLVLGLVLLRMLRLTTQEGLRNRVYLRNASDGIQITDASGRLVEANDRLCAMLGYSRRELLAMGPQWQQCWPDAAARQAMLAHAGPGRAPLSIETTLRDRHGNTLEVEVRCSHFRWSNHLHVHASVRDISERRANAEKIEHLAFYDPLTNLPNRRLMLERLNHALVGCERHQSYCALMMIDIDNFKTLNDTLGHGVGDQLLVEVARRLQSCIRAGDTAARMGGDEFVVILEDLQDSALAASQAEAVAEKILHLLREPYSLQPGGDAAEGGAREFQCSASIGLALFDDHALSTDELLKRSDTAMYQAKAAGRNAVRFFDPQMQSRVDAHAALEADLRHAVAENQLQLYYQPQVDASGQVRGAEVLLRWQHPQRGMVMPSHFIPLAEETGLILPIGAWVLESACRQLRRWAEQGGACAALTIAVNVSARQFHQSGFVAQVQDLLRSTQAHAPLLKLELTESLMVNNVEETVRKMEALHALGISFSLDDFGTGYSSLSYLQRLPLDQLKIDQSFVRDLLDDAKDAAIAQTVIHLAQNLGLSVIAEGVETAGQRDFLHSLGCYAYQGYLFGRPCPLPEFERLLRVQATL